MNNFYDPAVENYKTLKPWVSEIKLTLKERIRWRLSDTGGYPKAYKCPYDSSRFELYKSFRRREVPLESKDLGLTEWYITGKCPSCGIEAMITSSPNSYLW
jgi:hypothetical protein